MLHPTDKLQLLALVPEQLVTARVDTVLSEWIQLVPLLTIRSALSIHQIIPVPTDSKTQDLAKFTSMPEEHVSRAS